MTQRSQLSEDQIARLQYMLNNDYSYRAMAKEFGCCTDTLKRILVREGLAEFDGAKYAISPLHKSEAQMWERPCMRCKDATPRPKWQYICDKCTSRLDTSGVPDSFLEAGVDEGEDFSDVETET